MQEGVEGFSARNSGKGIAGKLEGDVDEKWSRQGEMDAILWAQKWKDRSVEGKFLGIAKGVIWDFREERIIVMGDLNVEEKSVPKIK